MRARSWSSPRVLRLLAGLALLLTLMTTGWIAVPRAQAAGPVDPREVALTLADLQAGFAVDPAVTGLSILPDSVGVSLRVDMRRQATPQNLLDGPIIVQQIIVRIDGPVAAEAVLASIRDELIRDAGMSPTPEGPNDGGTVSLKRTEGDVILYSVGFVKGNMVVFTTTGGLAPVTTFARLVDLAGITSARLDAAAARP
ncbi:MAG: hypothetical protein IT306_01465 [Chloroflexi bacterium]|nr:hypothetical protein [Chloroflexota bacterium]